MRKYFMKVKVIRWTQEELVGVRNCQWSFQSKFKEDYKIHFSQPTTQSSKLKSFQVYLSLTLTQVKLVIYSLFGKND